MSAPNSAPARPYRGDIDGLRAIAVLAVIAFHVHFSAFPGGYVGVDVFFVISGYLIGSIILEEIGAGQFSLLGFYERRVRRIFPALAALLLLLSIPAYLFLLPGELARYGASVLAATFSVSNFYFLTHTTYFAAPAYDTPLLHTWSLAIEEQFYLFLPVFLLLLNRLWPKRLPLVVLAVTLASLAMGARQGLTAQDAAFYLPWSRAWELLLGTLLALKLFPTPTTARGRNLAALAGLLLILVPAAAYNSKTLFPGLAALAPCGGAVLIIAASMSGNSLVGRVLASQPLAFIGKISYSLYLWHWPVIVFMILSGIAPATHQSSLQNILAVAVSFVLATLSWRFVETPFRSGAHRPARAMLFGRAGAAAAVLAVLGLGAIVTHGLPQRLSPQAAAIAGYLNYDWIGKGYLRMGSCFLDTGNAFGPFRAGDCIAQHDRRPSVLLLGDSHAAHLWYGLSKAFPGVDVLQATSPFCKPFLTEPAGATPVCRRMMDFIFEDFLIHNRIDRLILAGAWYPGDLVPLAATLDWAAAHGIKVVLVGPIPLYDEPLPRLLVRALRNGDPVLVDRHRVVPQALDDAMRRLAAEKGAAYLSLIDTICPRQSCTALAAPDVPLQFDIAHLTPEGSLWVGERLRESKEMP